MGSHELSLNEGSLNTQANLGLTKRMLNLRHVKL